MYPYVSRMYSHVARMYSYVSRLLLVCYPYVLVCYSYVLVCYPCGVLVTIQKSWFSGNGSARRAVRYRNADALFEKGLGPGYGVRGEKVELRNLL